VNLTGTRDGSNNLTIGFIRRTRYGGQWLDGTGVVPLNETVEAYEIDILEADWLTRVRTIAWTPGTYDANGNPTAFYSAADQSADGYYTPGDPVRICIYQISSVVSRGFGTKKTV
jgi:hypothetical protein